MPIHFANEIDVVLEKIPLDYVIFPYNFYHNIIWDGRMSGDFSPLALKLREKSIGIVTMKPLGTDWFIKPLIDAAKKIEKNKDISVPQAALRYIVNSGLKPDATITGMYTMNHLYEDIPAYYNPKMSTEETNLLENLKKKSKVIIQASLPEYYKFLAQWAPKTPDFERYERA
jgi:hypothetical protein